MDTEVCTSQTCNNPTFPGYALCYHCFRSTQHAEEDMARQTERLQTREQARQRRKERKAAERQAATARAPRASKPRPGLKPQATSTTRKAAKRDPSKLKGPFWICGDCGIAIRNDIMRCHSCGRHALPQHKGRTAPQVPRPQLPQPRTRRRPREEVSAALDRQKSRPKIVQAPPEPSTRALKPPTERLPERSPGWWETNDRW